MRWVLLCALALALVLPGPPVAAAFGGRLPQNVKFYYWYLDRVDGRAGAEHAVSVLSQFDLLIIREPGELSQAERPVVDRLRAAGKPLYGYLDLADGATPAQLRALLAGVERIAQAGYAGVFFDQAGYDYKVPRSRLNAVVTYVHSRGLKAMVNAWVPADVLERRRNPAMNPLGVPTALGPGDWVLLESFYHRSDDRFPTGNEMTAYTDTLRLARQAGVQVVGLTYHFTRRPLADGYDRAQALQLATLLGLDGFAYGRSDNNEQVPWPRLPSLPKAAAYCGQAEQAAPGLWLRPAREGVAWFRMARAPERPGSGILPARRLLCRPDWF